MVLLEVILGERFFKFEKGWLWFYKIFNVNKVLDFVVSKGVKLVLIGVEGMLEVGSVMGGVVF